MHACIVCSNCCLQVRALQRIELELNDLKSPQAPPPGMQHLLKAAWTHFRWRCFMAVLPVLHKLLPSFCGPTLQQTALTSRLSYIGLLRLVKAAPLIAGGLSVLAGWCVTVAVRALQAALAAVR